MATAQLHPFTLRFSSSHLEQVFRVDYARRSLVLVRWAIVVGTAQFALFGLLDRLMVPASFETIQRIRLVSCGLLVLCLVFTFSPLFRRWMQGFLTVPPLIAGLSVTVMAVVGQGTDGYYDYYAGVLVVLIFVHVLLRLRFVVASAVGGVLIGVYLGAAAAIGTPGALLANNAFFLLSANFTGMVASYALERYARLGFLHARRQAESNTELQGVLTGLRTAQAQLVRQEKLASLGRLTAGVAHEIKNPLNFVNNFAALSQDLVDELGEALAEAGERPCAAVCTELADLFADLRQNAERIAEHGARADSVVRTMLEHARGTSGERRFVDLAKLVSEHAELTYESFRTRHPQTACALKLLCNSDIGEVDVAPQEVGRVVINLVSNALLSVQERAHQSGTTYMPIVTVSTRRHGRSVVVEVADNGVGIPPEVSERLFEPFFTTRPAGQGMGLGLSLAAEIAASHGGALTFESKEGEGATFCLTLAVKAPGAAAPTVGAGSSAAERARGERIPRVPLGQATGQATAQAVT